MTVSCKISDVIEFLTKCQNEGYQTVELIDDSRAVGWKKENPTLEFIFSNQEPKVIGIDARKQT